MCDSSTDSSELNNLMEKINIENTIDTIFDGLKAVEMLTNIISVMVTKKRKGEQNFKKF